MCSSVPLFTHRDPRTMQRAAPNQCADHHIRDLAAKSNYHDLGRYAEVDLAIPPTPKPLSPCRSLAKRLITATARARSTSAAPRSRRRQARARSPAGGHRLGRQPDHHRAPVGEVWHQIQNEDWSLVSDVTFLSTGRLGCGTSRSTTTTSAATAPTASATAPRPPWARAGEQEARPADRQHSVRWRSQLRAGRPVDRRPSQDSAADDHAQQPRLSSGTCTSSAWPRARARHRPRPIGNSLTIPTSTTRRWPKLGVHSAGPITNPNDLGPALQRAIEVVSREPVRSCDTPSVHC